MSRRRAFFMLVWLAVVTALRGCVLTPTPFLFFQEHAMDPEDKFVTAGAQRAIAISKSPLHAGPGPVEEIKITAEPPLGQVVKVQARAIKRGWGGGAANMARAHQ